MAEDDLEDLEFLASAYCVVYSTTTTVESDLPPEKPFLSHQNPDYG